MNILLRKIEKFREYLAKLDPYTKTESSVLLENEEKRVAMERWFQLLVDEAVDVNAMIISMLAEKSPESYKSSFYDLADLGVIKADFAEKIANSAKIRNQLIHDYEVMQKKDVIENIKHFYPLFVEYATIIIGRFVEKS